MNTFLSWWGFAGTAVLLVAVGVAWLEHRRRVVSRHPDRAWFDTDTDTETDTDVLSRMVRDKTEPMQRDAWADTQPQFTSAPSGPAQRQARAAVE